MNTQSPVRILVVDEEEPITHVLRLGLELEGWEVTVAASGREALAHAASADIVLLDMMLPDELGTDVVAGLRAAGSTAHVIFLTGRDDLDDRMAAYSAGADDYITKPFGVEEVVDRVEAAARRRGLVAGSLRVADLVLDTRAGLAWRGDEFLHLNSFEFELLRQLVESRGTRLTASDLSQSASRHDVRLAPDRAMAYAESARCTVNASGEPLVLADGGGWVIR